MQVSSAAAEAEANMSELEKRMANQKVRGGAFAAAAAERGLPQ
jgi:hypothetical protein